MAWAGSVRPCAVTALVSHFYGKARRGSTRISQSWKTGDVLPKMKVHRVGDPAGSEGLPQRARVECVLVNRTPTPSTRDMNRTAAPPASPMRSRQTTLVTSENCCKFVFSGFSLFWRSTWKAGDHRPRWIPDRLLVLKRFFSHFFESYISINETRKRKKYACPMLCCYLPFLLVHW